MSHFHLAIGAVREGSSHHTEHFPTPFMVRYSDGYRSVSMAVKGTNAQINVTYGWCGWVERETT